MPADYPTLVCGYCGNEFKNLNANMGGRHPCPQCRSWKVSEPDDSTENEVQ